MLDALQKANMPALNAKQKINLSWLYLWKENNYSQT